jgi:hypothetical protein
MGKGIQLLTYKKVSTYFIFAVNHDLRHKGRMIASGHLTGATHKGAYSGVISPQHMCMCIT